MNIDWKYESLRFLFSIGATIVFILLFSFFLDCFLWLISGGWEFPIDTVFSEGERVYGNTGSWPIVSGTVQRSLTAPMGSLFSLLIVMSFITRMIIGNRRLFYEKGENSSSL